MAKILFIADHRPNRSPSQRFRFEQYLSILKEAGHEFEYSWLLDEDDDKLLYREGKYFQKALLLRRAWKKRKLDLRRANKFDIIFIQREAILGASTYFERKFFSSGAKVIFDFDDSIWKLDISEANKKFAFLKNPAKTSKLIKNAHVVIAGNEYLADYALNFNKNVVVIPTTINTKIHAKISTNKDNKKIIIGWTGSLTTIKHFKLAENFLKQLKEKYQEKIGIKIIGDKTYTNSDLELISIPWSASTEIEDLCDIDIGIMPLPDDEWSKGKCGLKGLQYMALGIPTVMSPVGVNTKIIRHAENGYLAENDEDWINIISNLIEHPELRAQIGKSAINTVQQEYSVDANAKKYLEIITNLLIKI